MNNGNKERASLKNNVKHARVRSTVFQMTAAHEMYYIISDYEMS